MEILLVEDIAQYQEIIVRHLHNLLPQPLNIRVCGTIGDAQETISQQIPELLLLDIHLPDGTGFELLERIGLERLKFKLIFISAHDDYAIKAFKFSAIDYVLKPINIIDFQNALAKVKQFNREDEQVKLSALQTAIQSKEKVLKNLILKDANAIYRIDIQDIVRCESSNNYTLFLLKDGRKLVVSTTLKEYDKLLKGLSFFRSHQSHLINLHYFDRYDKRDGGYIVMKDESIIPLSRGRRELLIKSLEALT